MARQEADREDLFAEARALTRKIEARCPQTGLMILVGQRESGWLSVYLGPDLMYQFDAEGRLRRALCQGCLYRTQGHTLARLIRERSSTETTLVRHDLTPAELDAFRQKMLADVSDLGNAFAQERYQILRQEPPDDPHVLPGLLQAIRHSLTAEPWLAAAIPGKA